jgi:PKD repeat protein
MHWSPILVAAFLLVIVWVGPGGAPSTSSTPTSLVVASPPPANCAASVAGALPSSSPMVQAAVARDPSDAGIDLDFCSTIAGVTGAYYLNWTFGDGTRSTVRDPVHVYLQPANYTVVLTLNSSDYNTTSTIYALVNASVQASASFAPLAPTTATAVNLTDSARLGTPPYSVFWSFGDNMTATGMSVLHTYHQAGTYTVQVWTNDTGGGSTYQLFQVIVKAAPNNNQPTGGTDILIGTTVAGVAVALAGFAYFQWDKKRKPKMPTLTPPPQT